MHKMHKHRDIVVTQREGEHARGWPGPFVTGEMAQRNTERVQNERVLPCLKEIREGGFWKNWDKKQAFKESSLREKNFIRGQNLIIYNMNPYRLHKWRNCVKSLLQYLS